jgi:transcriptional regulator with XRE-family HTH domain
MSQSTTTNGHRATTILHHLKVLGAGTAQVESLSGYFARLARSHLHKPGVFYHRQLIWHHQGEPRRVGEFSRAEVGLVRKPAMNLPPAASRWIALLARLTEVDNLALTTFIPWGDLFAQRGFHKHRHTYCPHCYADDPKPYERLLWLLGPVTVCPVHRCRLLDSCPHCGDELPVISYRSKPGHCPRDYQPLKDAAPATPVDSIPEGHPGLWTARQCATLVEHFQNRPVSSQSYDIAASLRHCLERAGLTDAADFGRFLGCSRITAYYWLQGKSRPPLAQILSLCRGLGIDALDLLERRTPIIQSVMGSLGTRIATIRLPLTNPNSALETRAWRLLGDSAASPPNLSDLATQLGTNARFLRKHFPELARQVVENHTAHRRQRQMTHDARVTDEIRTACNRIFKDGLIPTRRRLGQKLSQPGLLRSPRFQRAASDILKKLGC